MTLVAMREWKVCPDQTATDAVLAFHWVGVQCSSSIGDSKRDGLTVAATGTTATAMRGAMVV